MLDNILEYLNDLFETDKISGRKFVDAYRNDNFLSMFFENIKQLADNIHNACIRNNILNSNVEIWWRQSGTEYLESRKYLAIAKSVIFNWIAKILFAHILSNNYSKARTIYYLSEDMTHIRMSVFT